MARANDQIAGQDNIYPDTVAIYLWEPLIITFVAKMSKIAYGKAAG
ncbi:hypothetical protein MNBD_NITROSPINAE03-1281 [hydrothermal vent metagenome]|uniref:Uncharacterized protein n=1 Tax=hydrothermal vent metagenome TaxID=652676 RepID=A0A3B1C598_9ZZZZ